MDSEQPNKRRKIHMDEAQCMQHMSKEEGAKALTNPSVILKSSKDPNRGLYPRSGKKDDAFLPQLPSLRVDPTLKGTFITASELLGNITQHNRPVKKENGNVTMSMNYLPTQKPSPNKDERKKVPKPKIEPQKNSLFNYFATGTKQKKTASSTATFTSALHVHTSQNPSHSDDCEEDTTLGESLLCSPSKNSPLIKVSCKMYSPIKRVSDQGNTYVMDEGFASNSLVPNTSERIVIGMPKSNSNLVVKTLFDGQKNLSQNTKNGKKKQKPQSKFNRENPFLYSTEGNLTLSNSQEDKTNRTVKNEDKYGLLGTGFNDFEEDRINYFEILPMEVIENIFCRLPMMDLCLNVNRVCTQWNDIISDEKFVPWKKTYFKLKIENYETVENMSVLMAENEMKSSADYLLGLIKYMKGFKPITAKNMNECLQKHPKYLWVEALLKERLLECFSKDCTPNPWCVVAALVVVSETVQDIEGILICLLSSSSQSTALEISECLYCVLSFLFMFKLHKRSDVWNGMHYRLYYALYLFENESSSTTSQLTNAFNKGGQQSILKYGAAESAVRMTHEQLRICNHELRPHDCIKIVAFAGTGKTTTLVKYTQLRPSMKFLLVVYNKSMSEHAKSKFPPNVEVRTSHSLAFQIWGRRYAAAGKLGNIKVNDILNHFKAVKGESLYVQAKFILNTINSFMATADPCITVEHVPEYKLDDRTGKKKSVDMGLRNKYAEDAQKIWNMMCDLKNKPVRMTHDGYLKMYQLNRPKLKNYHVILIDEAQDLTPAIADVLLSQSQPKILVGDPHQQIYSFRGAVNAMQQVKETHIFYLTQSFRFGPEIAFVAASFLELLKAEKKKILVGNGSRTGIRGDSEGQLAIITRANFTLFNEAVKICCFSDTQKRIAFVGGTAGFGFPMIMDIYALMLTPEDRIKEKRQIKNPFLANFPNLGELEKYATKTTDNELLGKIRIVKTYHTQLPSHINKILSKCIGDTDTADIVLTTAHKSKGLEFTTVKVTDDFTNDFHPLGILPELRGSQEASSDESNLLYVAVTRAKKRLLMSPTVFSLLKHVGEQFNYPVLSTELQHSGKVMHCNFTGRDFEPCAITLVKREVRLSDGTLKESGVYCPQAVTEELPSQKKLYGSLIDERQTNDQQLDEDLQWQLGAEDLF